MGAGAVACTVLHLPGPVGRHHLGAVDRLPGRHHPPAAVPAVHPAGEVAARDAGDPAGDPGAPEAVRQRPPGHEPGHHGAAEGARRQPPGRLPADPAADPDLPGAVPRPAPAGPGCGRPLRLVLRAHPAGGDRQVVRCGADLRVVNMTGHKEQAILAIPGVTYGGIRTVAFALIIVMCATTFFTQKQIMARSGPVEGQAAMVQKLMLYGMPVSLFVSGFIFPIGVLIYWLINNLWTLGQQFYILKKMPPPGSDAAKAKAAADKPAIDPKALAPKPGAKPVRTKGGRPTIPAVDAESGIDAEPGIDAGPAVEGQLPVDGTAASSDGAAAPGQPPARGGSSGSRPAGAARGGKAPANRGKRKRR